MSLEFSRELEKYDKERVLVAWDALVEKQQNKLEQMGFPCMFVTSNPDERAKQQKIVNIILNAV
jgi:hypothetical protein